MREPVKYPNDFFSIHDPIIASISGILKGIMQIPASVLKQWVNIVDPPWRVFLPQTTAGAVAALTRLMDPDEWFAHLLESDSCAIGATKQPPNNLICPDKKGTLTADENKLKALMIAVNMAEVDQSFIFFEEL